MPPFAPPSSRHASRSATCRTEAEWRVQDTPQSSTSTKDMMLSSRRKECTRKDRPASGDPPESVCIPFPTERVSMFSFLMCEFEMVTHVRCRGISLQVWLDRLVLFVEVRQVWYQVLDNVGVRQGVDLHLLGLLSWDAACEQCQQKTSSCAQFSGLRYLHKQASVFMPLIFIAQLPQMPSLQLLRKVRVGSSSFLIRTRASSTMGPVLFRSRV